MMMKLYIALLAASLLLLFGLRQQTQTRGRRYVDLWHYYDSGGRNFPSHCEEEVAGVSMH